MKLVSIFRNELKINVNWHLGWIIGLFSTILLIIMIYPGDEAIRDFMPLLQTDLFEAFIGSIGGASPDYTLWVAILMPMISIIYFLYGLMTGVKVAVQSITDQTGELIHTLPVSRNHFILIRMLVTAIPFSIFIILQFILYGTNLFGYSIEINKLLTISIWLILFFLGSMIIGVMFGLIAGNTGRGWQFSLLFVLFLYSIQILGRLQPDFNDLNNFNPLNFYQPEIVLLTNTMKEGVFLENNYPQFPVYLILLSSILILFALFEFNRKDLSDDAGFSLNLFNRTGNKNTVRTKIGSIWKIIKSVFVPKNVKNNPFVFWGRLFEKKLPITADFIYSDKMTLFISVLAIITIFPFQLGLYPGDELIKESIAGFTGNPFFLIITYGINLGSTPYLWFVISQALGIIWIVLMPLSYYWVRKAINRENKSGTGEIIGSLPLNNQSVVFQRIFAIFLELTYLVLWMIIFVIFSEYITGSTYNLLWEIITLICLLPFYLFLISAMIFINLAFRKRGDPLSGLFLIFIVVSYIISIVNDSFNLWYIRGIFVLYNPVLILQEQSIFVANYGLLILIIASFFLLAINFKLASRFLWIHVIEESNS